jgi:hypothetical protein
MPRKKKPVAVDPLEQAEAAGAAYADEQFAGSYFLEWVRDQMHEAEEMRQRDPNSVIRLETKGDYQQVAKNMLQQLRWDVARDIHDADLRSQLGDNPSKEARQAFFDGFNQRTRDQTIVNWLADEVEQVHRDMVDQQRLPGVQAREAPRAKVGITPEQRAAVNAALEHYGAFLSNDDFIANRDKVLGVRVEVSKGRLRMVSREGNLLASYPVANIGTGVANFVEQFWYWKPLARERGRSANEMRVHARGGPQPVDDPLTRSRTTSTSARAGSSCSRSTSARYPASSSRS